MDNENVVIHPSRIQGMGGFARRPLARGTHVIEYVGRKILKAESLIECERDNEYVFALDDQYDLDGNVDWNPARFLNHSCSPNCEAELIEGHIWITALRDIMEDEELTFDYGYDLVDYKDHPCHCGAPNCYGYIVSAELRKTKAD